MNHLMIIERLLKAATLPKLNLPNDSWRDLSYLVNDLTEKNISELTLALAHATTSSALKKVKSQIVPFMRAWFDLTSNMSECLRSLASCYKEIQEDENQNKDDIVKLGSDDCLSLLIEFLPNRLDELQLILQKLEYAMRINVTNDLGCALTIFYSSVYSKIQEMTLEHTIVNLGIKQIADKIKQKENIKRLLIICESYKDTLAAKLIGRLKVVSALTYQEYAINLVNGINVSSDKNIVNKLLEDNNIEWLQSNQPEYQLYLNQYLCLDDITATLTRKKQDPILILNEFTAKFRIHQHMFTTADNAVKKDTPDQTFQRFGMGFFTSKSEKDNFLILGNRIAAENELAENYPEEPKLLPTPYSPA